MSSFVTFQRNILLDTPTEESRIQDFHIGRLLFAQERIYVIDEKENKILMFNDEGKFLKSIGGATGEVSGNRLKIQDAALDAQPQKLYAYCSTTCQIMVFDLDLNVEQTIPMVTPFARNRAGRKLPVCHPDIPEKRRLRACGVRQEPIGGRAFRLVETSRYPLRETNSRRNIHPARKIAFTVWRRHLCKLAAKQPNLPNTERENHGCL